MFLAIGVFSGIVGRLSGDEIGKAFVDGAKDMVNAALIIGTARAILIVAQDGKILDTILSGLAGAISTFHPLVSAQLMFVSQCVINFFVHSGTAQAALTIPIMAPLGDLVGITRQTSVFAFQLAEYINPVLPTSGRDDGGPGARRVALGEMGQVAGAAPRPLGPLRRPGPHPARADEVGPGLRDRPSCLRQPFPAALSSIPVWTK